MPALFIDSSTRSRLPTCMATACVFSSWAWPSVMANSPSMLSTFRLSGAPMKFQNAALPAAVAMPMPDGPPFTSLVTSVVSECPARARMPRSPACANSGWSSSPLSFRSVARAPAPRRKPRASIGRMASPGSTR